MQTKIKTLIETIQPQLLQQKGNKSFQGQFNLVNGIFKIQLKLEL